MKKRGNYSSGMIGIAKSMTAVLLVVFSFFNANAQAPTCDAIVPFYSIDLTSNPDSMWVSPPLVRDGHCCGASSSIRCVSFEVVLGEEVAAVSFNIESGAIPPGALYYQVDCGSETVAGESFCLEGPGTNYITFCKPGNNTNTYALNSIARPTFPPDDSIRVGCSELLQTFGLEDAQTEWTSVFPGTRGQYDSYLSCTACASPLVSPTSATPAYVDYEVCGYPIADECGFTVVVCDTVRVYVFDALTATVSPDPASFCAGSSVTLTANASGGDGNYTYVWTDAGNNVLSTADTVTVSTVATYTLTLDDGFSDAMCPSFVLDVPVTIGDIQITASQIDDVGCKGESTGSIDINVTGGVAPYSYNWSHGPTTQDVSGLTAGSYSVTVSDANGCSASNSFNITEPVAIVSLSLNSVTDVSCNGFSDGAIDINVSGGTPGFTYSWSNGATSQDLSGIGAGSYSVTITDANGCTATLSQSVDEPSTLTASISATQYVGEVNVTCNGATDGAADLSVAGGTTNYTYSWSNGATTQDLSGIGAGSYSVTVTDANGCTVSASVNLVEPTVLTTSGTPFQYIGGNNVSCNGASDGSIDLSAAGGTPNYTYNWSNGASTQDISGLSAGSYSVTVTDANGCTASASFNLTEPAELTASATAFEYAGGYNISCSSASDGSIDLTVAGGITAYSYSWSNGATSQDLSGLNGGTYSVTVTDANGCTAATSITLTEPTPFNTSISAFDYAGGYNVSCNGATDGSIDLSVSGATPSYSYSWSNGASTQDLSGVGAGNYSVTVTDANGCTVSESITLTEPDELTASVDASLYAGGYNITCNGATDGSIDLTVAGGTTAYTYSWSNGASTQDLNGLGAGSYSVTVTDANGCTATASTTLTEPAELTASVTAFEYNGGYNISCEGAADGSIDLTVAGGTTAYTYSWSNGATSQDISGLNAGSYNVTVTDANGCTAAASITLTEPDELTASVDAFEYTGGNNVSCNGASDGSIDLTVAGGTTAYTYSWSNGATSQDISGLNAGSYSVTITDANGCTATTSITLTEPAELTASVDAFEYIGGNNVSCNGATDGSIDLSVAGGITAYSYSWSNGATTQDISGIGAGSYSVTVTDANGCTATASVTLTEPAELTASATAFEYVGGDNVSCNGATDGSIDLTVAGGITAYSYSWSNGASTQDLSGLGAGSYTVTVTDANGCTATASITLTEPTLFSTSTAGENISCNGFSDGSIDLTVSGSTPGYTYEWSTGATTEDISGLTAGNYTVTITDANGCTTTESHTLTEPATLTGEAVVNSNFGFNDPICGSNSTNYGQGTEQIGDIMPTTPNPFAQCDPGVPYFNIDLTGNADSVWLSDLFTRSGNCCGTTSPDRCVTFEVTLDPAAIGIILSISAGAEPPGSLFWELNCSGQNPLDSLVCLNGVGPHTITFCKPGNNANAYRISTVSSPIFPKDDSTRVGCSETYNLVGFSSTGLTWNSVSPGFRGQYNNYLSCTNCTSPSFNPDDNAPAFIDYEICGFAACGGASICDTFRIFILDSLPDADGYVSCNGEEDAAVGVDNLSGGTPPYTFQWSNGEVTQDITGIGPGTYTVTVTDANGCSFVDDITIGEPNVLIATAVGEGLTCNAASDGIARVIVTGGSLPYSYIWNTGSTNDSIFNIPSGTYTVTVTDGNGCTDTASVTVVEPNTLIGTLDAFEYVGGDNISCNGAADGSIDLSVSGGTLPYTYDWSNGASTQDLSGLAAGTYTVTVTDSNGCFTIESITLTEPDVLAASADAFEYNGGYNISCNGESDGSIDLTVTGGHTAYTYSWSNGATTEDLSNLPAGTYTVTVTDANGCSTTESITLTEPNALTLSTSVTDVTTNLGSDGAIDLTVNGGTPAYTYQWDNGATTEDLTNISAGTYCVTVTDANGCTASTCAFVSEPACDSLLINSVDVVNVSCFGFGDGSITINASTLNPPIQYSIDNGATFQASNTFTGLTPGTYDLVITDAVNCTTSHNAAITITQPDTLTASATATQYVGGVNITCNGESDGEIDLTVAGGTTPYSYNWSNGGTTQDLTGLPAGTYDVTVTDANGCTATASITLLEPLALDASATSPTFIGGFNISCNGESDGSIDLTVGGGIPGYTYSWSNGATTEDLSGLAAGTYSVTVTDANGCTATESITLTEPDEVIATATSFQYQGGYNISCFGEDDGSIDLAVTGGVTPYSYNWSNGATAQNLTGLTAGTYSVTVTDVNGCSATESITLTQPDELTASATAFQYQGGWNISCFGESDGSIDLTITGGTPAYIYIWSNGATTQDLSGLAAGTYDVTVTDANGCSTTESITLTEPAELTTTLDPFEYQGGYNISCNGYSDGSIDQTVAGGTQPYTYAWSNGATTEDISGLPAGTYTATVTDANGCTATASVTLTEPAGMNTSITAVTYAGGYNISCNGENDGEIDLTVSGGTTPYTYAWSNGPTTQDQTGLTAGTYTVTVTDANGCSTTDQITLTEPDPLTASITATTYAGGYNITCFGESDGAVDLTVQGGTTPYTYAWSNGATSEDQTGLTAGTYTVTVTDANDCFTTASITLTEPDSLEASVTSPTVAGGYNITCFGEADGSIDLTVTGGTTPYTYSWSNGATTQDLSGLTAGTYAVTVTDANGCTDTASITLTQPDELTASSTGTDVSCNNASDGDIDLTVTGGTMPYTYVWSNGPTTEDQTGLPTGTYTVTITDANGCSTTNSITLTQPDVLDLTYTTEDVVCYGESNGSIDLTVTGGTTPYTYAWSNGPTTEDQTGLAAGTYTVTVSDANGCTSTTSATINQPDSLIATLDAFEYQGGVNISCNGESDGSIDLTVVGGTQPYNYLWDDGTITEDRSGLPAGTYAVTVTDGNGCTDTASVTLIEPDVLDISPIVTDVQCEGNTDGAIDIVTTGGTAPYTYLWSNGATTMDLSGIGAGVYSVTVTDANGCTDQLTVTVGTESSLVINTGVTEATCGQNNGEASVSVSGGVAPYTYIWDNNANTPSLVNIAPGNYCVTVTDANGCMASRCLSVGSVSNLMISATSSPVLCPATTGDIDLTVSGGTTPYTYNWSNGGTTEDLTGLAAGTYCVTVTDASGCIEALCIDVTVEGPFSISLDPTDATCGQNNGAIALLTNGGVAPFTYMWSNGATTQNLTGIGPGFYSVTVTDANGCTGTESISISELNGPTVTVDATNPTCNDATGSVDVTVTGIAPFDYTWSNDSTGQDITGVTPGTYTLTVTDANGCETTITVVLDAPTPIDIVATKQNANCYNFTDGSITVSVSGGAGAPYSFDWSTGPNDTTNSISGLSDGMYSVTVTDANGCDASTNITITEPDTLVSSAATVTDVYCPDGSDGAIDVDVTGGTTPYTYDWSTGDTTQDLSGLTAGTYTLIVTDANGCAADTLTVTVSQPDPIIATANTITSVSCNGLLDGGIDVTVTGGTGQYFYFWDNGETTEDLTGIGAGTYCLIVGDSRECESDTFCFTVTEPDLLTVDIVVVDTVLCYNSLTGDLLADPSGGTQPYTFLWNFANATTDEISGLSAGSYNVTVTDANGCTATADQPLILENPDSIVINGEEFPESCERGDGSIEFEVNGAVGGYTESWTQGSNSLPNNFIPVGLDSGIYTIQVTDSRGCQGQTTFEVDGPGICNDKPVAVDDTASASCGGSANIPVLDNDFDPNNDNLHVDAIIDDPDYGSVTVNSDGTVDYTPDEGFVGTDTFTYVVCDDGVPSFCDTAIVVITVLPCEIPDFFIPNVITPNGDGANDQFIVEGLNLFARRELKLFNRWGGEIYSADVYDNNWDGTNKNGEDMPDGTYYYILVVGNPGAETKEYAGYIVLHR